MRVKIGENKLFQSILKKRKINISSRNINGLSIDSRLIQKGDIFFPLKGEHCDGHDFIDDALNNGASYIVAEKSYELPVPTLRVNSVYNFLMTLVSEWRTYFNYPFIGITGSNGKTTTKELLAHILSKNFKIVYTKDNYNSTIGAPISLFAFELDADFAIVEMGASKPGEIQNICNVIKPTLGLITNICDAHIEYFQTTQEIVKTKSALFASLPINGTAFINSDDPYISKLQHSCNDITYSFNSNSCSNYVAKWISDFDFKNMSINGNTIEVPYNSKIFGKNVLAAFSIACEAGLGPNQIASQIKTFKIPKGRGEILKSDKVIIINDSYNSNLVSAISGISYLMNYPSSGRKIVVIGDMLELGDLKFDHHKRMGSQLVKFNPHAVFATGPLSEYTIQAMDKFSGYKKHYSNKTNLKNELKNYIRTNDVIYIKGSRGMKMEKILAIFNI